MNIYSLSIFIPTQVAWVVIMNIATNQYEEVVENSMGCQWWNGLCGGSDDDQVISQVMRMVVQII